MKTKKVRIEKASNGYIVVTSGDNNILISRLVFTDLDAVFNYIREEL